MGPFKGSTSGAGCERGPAIRRGLAWLEFMEFTRRGRPNCLRDWPATRLIRLEPEPRMEFITRCNYLLYGN
jgi:hypothetical protein